MQSLKGPQGGKKKRFNGHVIGSADLQEGLQKRMGVFRVIFKKAKDVPGGNAKEMKWELFYQFGTDKCRKGIKGFVDFE